MDSAITPKSQLRNLFIAIDIVIIARAFYKLLEARWRYKYVPRAPEPKRPIRIWVDGVFDMMHFGHANMLRQARALGDYLVVGVNSDESVFREKGTYPVMTERERLLAVSACKWVDEVVENVPYVMSSEYIKMVMEKYHIDYFVHGDDPCFDAQGNDVYGHVKSMGKYRTVKRTEGVSTTELVGRMLLMTKDHHREGMQKLSSAKKERESSKSEDDDPQLEEEIQHEASIHSFGEQGMKPTTRVSQFLPTTRRLAQFSGGKAPKPTDRIVYMDGTWDLFHPGHIMIMKEAKKLGDFLLVGICDDETVNKHMGSHWPIMNLHERTLCVLSCKYVDEVIIGAPWEVTKDLITTMNISVVVHGTVKDSQYKNHDPYKVARELGLYKEIESPSSLSAQEIVDRIIKQKEIYEKRYEKKAKKEGEYLEQKTYVQEI